jgi:N-acetylmuramoyl-L-alanine amidase
MEKHVVLEIAGHVQKLLSEQPGIQAHLTGGFTLSVRFCRSASAGRNKFKRSELFF